MDVYNETKSSDATFVGNIYDGQIICKNGLTYELSVTQASQARLMIYTYEPKKLFHFGVLFENPTWELKVNGVLASAKGTKPYLYLENNCG